MKKLTCPKSLNNKKGFTLIELLVVIAILSILAVVVAIAINPAQKINQSKDAKIYSDIGQIAGVLQAYYTSVATGSTSSYYPAAVGNALSSTTLPSAYLGSIPVEPGGNSYKYYTTTTAVSGSSGFDGALIYSSSYSGPSGSYICWDSTNGAVKNITAVPSSCGASCKCY